MLTDGIDAGWTYALLPGDTPQPHTFLLYNFSFNVILKQYYPDVRFACGNS